MSDESMWRAVHAMNDAAQRAHGAADRLEQATQQLRVLFEDGYGGNALKLIELLEVDTRGGGLVPVGYIHGHQLADLKDGNTTIVKPNSAFGETVELFTAPQKPAEVSDSIAMQNVKDIAHCLSDIRRFVETKFMTVGDLPSPEGLLLSGTEWKHESDAIIAALNRVSDFYEQQKPVVRFKSSINPVMFNADVMFGYNKARAEAKAAIEAAGGKVQS